ncbi:hypothetical protein TNCV_4868451 [Trichonephila clavipes]|nr:hypothetical protein TNCV_4868451 [Trichonephila clavipes]
MLFYPLVAGRHWEMEREAFLHPISNIVRCGLMWKGLDGRESPDWFRGRGKEAWLQEQFWRLSELEEISLKLF